MHNERVWNIKHGLICHSFAAGPTAEMNSEPARACLAKTGSSEARRHNVCR
jgi:hypothetical protein